MTRTSDTEAEIAAVIGPDATAKLLAVFGGTTFEMPAILTGSILAETIGETNARKLDAAFGVGKLTLPLSQFRGRGARKRKAIEMFNEGATLRDVALACEVHIRTVSRWKKEMVGE